MNRELVVLLYFFCFFFSTEALHAQSEEEKQPLTIILEDIEKRFNVTFTYADANVNTIKIIPPSRDLNLDDTLKALTKKTGLRFENLSNDNIIVRKIPEVEPLPSFRLQILDEVEINNFLTRGIAKRNDGTIRFKTKKFGILPGLIEPDVLQMIQALPGIQSIDETVSNLNIRGGTNDQNLMLWNNIKMYQSGHFFGLISAFNPYLTTDVIVVKNGTSAYYGDSTSSIVNMLQKQTISGKFSGGAGSNLIHADAYATIPTSKNSELQISARRSLTDVVNTPTYDQYFKRIAQDSDLSNTSESTSLSTDANFYFYDASLQFLYDITEADNLRVNLLTIYNDLNYQETATTSTADEALNSGLSQFNLAGSLYYQKKWNRDFTTDIQLYISQYDLDATNFDIINEQRLIQENKVIDGGLKINSSYHITDDLKWYNGYQFSEVGISNLEDVNNPIFRRYIKEVIRSHSAFTEGYFKSNSGNTHIKAGLRANYFPKFEKILLEPRLSFSQNISNHLKVEVLGEFKSQTTTQIIDRQSDFLGVEKRRWILSNNANIPIVKSKQVSAGFHYYKNKLRINLEGYFKDVNGITTRSQGFQNQYQFVNAIGSYQIKGLDFLINKQFETVSTWLSYSYSKNDYTFESLNEGKSFPNNLDTRHAISFAGTYSYNNLKLALGLNWRSGKPNTEPQQDNEVISGDINYESPNRSNLNNYIRTDASATYDFELSRSIQANAGISLWNVLNQKNIINTYYTIDDQDTISQITNESLGITPNISFRMRF